MPRPVLVIAILLAGPAGALAQQGAFVGVVRDSASGAALAGVGITIRETGQQGLTDSTGYFRVGSIPTGDYTIFVRQEGYEPWAVRLHVTVRDARNLPLGVIRLAPRPAATFVGVVRDSTTGTAVSRARVSIDDDGPGTETDRDGHFELPGVQAGAHTVHIARLGYAEWTQRIRIAVPRPTRVDFGMIDLGPAPPIALEDITVEEQPFEASMMMSGFLRRMQTEQGTFLTYEDIARIDPVQTSDILRRIPGMNTMADGSITSGRAGPAMRSFELCTVQYYIDGVKVTASSLDVVLPAAIAGIEVYRGSATIPQIFRSQADANCGVIAVWTRDGSARSRHR